MASQELRPYQEKMLDSIVAARLAGQNRVLVQAATGVGKTTVFSSLPTRLGPWLDSLPQKHRKMLVIAHREELIAQAVTRIRQNNPGLIVTKEKGNECANVYSDVIVASIQTLDARDQRRLHRLLVHMQFGLVIVDECFPAGTLVDGRPIESVRVGEMVTAFCPRTGVIEQKRVVRLMCKAPTGIVRVRASNGVTLHCTPNHRIWTMRGWVRAEDLRRSDTIAVTTEPPNENQDRNTRPVSPLPRPETVGHEGPNRHVQAQRPGLLFGRVQGQDNIRGVVGADGTDESEARIGADEAEQPDAAGLGTREDAGVTSQDRPQADVAWRQREADPVAAGRAGAGARLGDRSRGQDQGAEGGHLPDELQDRHRQQADADRDRSRRPESRGEITTGARLEKGRVSRWARVDDLEVLEPGSDGRFGGVCADGLVYNLEVEDFHTYAANGIFVSNCHHASADSYRRVLAVLGFLPDHGGVAPLDSLLSSTKRTEAIAARMNAWDAVAPQDRLLVGFTATPNRTDAVGLSVVFQTIAFSYPMKAAIKDAWLAPPRALAVATDASLEAVRTTAGEFNQKDLATAVNTPQRNAQALLAWQQHALGRPTLGFTVDVAHAHAAADLWQKAGHRFLPISGQTPDDDRRRLLRQYTEGQIDGLFNAMLLTEGTDLPRTSCILHLKPTKSATLYTQMTGRGLRLFPGKDDCLILDMVDISRKHSLMAAPVLYGLPPLINAKGQRLDVLEADIAALRDEHAGVDLDAILSSLTDLDQLRSRLVEVNVFDVQPLDPSVLQATHLDWMRAGEVYRLNYPWSDGHETVRVSQDMLGHWDVAVEFHPRAADATALRQRTIASQIANLATAVMLGESYVTEQRGSVAKMKSRTARWKGNPASTKQMEFLKRLRVPFNAATLTSGAAGALIDSALHHRRGRR